MKMIQIILSIFCCFLFSFTNENEFRIITNEGIGNAKVNNSNFSTVKKAFPGGKFIKEVSGGTVHGTVTFLNRETAPLILKMPKQFARTYTIEREGISFYFNFLDTLSSITIWGKNMYKTDKGIVLGVSTFRDLDSLYGKSSFGRIHSRLVKIHDNLIFYAKDLVVLKEKYFITNNFNDLKIEEIKVVIN